MKIEMKDIHKSFGSNQVLMGVNISIESGEVHSLMGENGAGKSTMMNILSGIHQADKGQIIIDGVEKHYKSARDSEKDGIAFVHQELNIWPDLTILENLFLGKEITNKFKMIDKAKMHEVANKKLKEIGIDLPLDELAKNCSLGIGQMCEIVRALMMDAKVIIMDEPTAALSERESEKLFEVIKKLKSQGVAIIYISHRMEEVFDLSDKITVMRDGKTISTRNIDDTDCDQVVKEMVGRELSDFYSPRESHIGEEFLRVENLSSDKFKNINFNVHSGEIIGFAGLMGAGRTEVMRALFGLDQKDSGKIYVKGKEVIINNPSDAIKNRIGFVSEDRKNEGLLLDETIHENIILPNLKKFAPKGTLKEKELNKYSDTLSKRLNVKMVSTNDLCSSLSGGNQQKVVLAKWIGVGPDILILDEPTRGIDVGAKREIYDLMNELTNHEVAIIMVSSELSEVLGMSDRIYVMHEGKIAGELNKNEADQEKIMHLATGGH